MKLTEKKYTLNEFKEMFEKAEMEVLLDPTKGMKGADELDETNKMLMMLTGMVITTQLKKILFGEKE